MSVMKGRVSYTQWVAATEQAPVVRRSSRVTRRPTGTFYYSVDTTRVYCRPSYGVGLAWSQNVRLHPTRECEGRRDNVASLIDPHSLPTMRGGQRSLRVNRGIGARAEPRRTGVSRESQSR